jgi:hypothetical protein
MSFFVELTSPTSTDIVSPGSSAMNNLTEFGNLKIEEDEPGVIPTEENEVTHQFEVTPVKR